MCGIFGYSGKKDASKLVVEGLKRLEYRGYDSWGVAAINEGEINVSKKVGPIGDLSSLDDMPKSHVAIGHTRWATHGGVTETNAHPHFSTDKSFVVAQNGIVENYQELKKELQEKGYKFVTQTDTEIIVRLIEEKLKTEKELIKAVQQAFLDLKGRNTIIILTSVDDHMIAVRHGSPLVIGVGKDEIFFASDTLSFADQTDEVVYVNDFEMMEYKNGKLELYDVKTGEKLKVEPVKIDHGDVTINKEGYDHYMLKEIIEQKYTIREAVQYTDEDFKEIIKAVKEAKSVFTIGCGGAFYAADQVAYLLRTVAGLNSIGLRAYEMESYEGMMEKGDVIIAVSQSGETADTLEALEIAKKKGLKIASVVNMVGSTTTRISDYPFFSRSGPEICVISTKSGTAQVAFGYLLAESIAGKNLETRTEIDKLSDYLQQEYLSDELLKKTKAIAEKLEKKDHLFLLGKGSNYVVSQIGALNMKEVSYIHAEAFTAGELKHGVIALIEEGTPVICFVDDDADKAYMLNAAAEVKTRGAHVIGIGVENNELFDDFIELPTISGLKSALIANVLPCQLIGYQLALLKGLNPDKPRNLAKSVTVK
jgi:glutamine---fructose-6-phosphate transaminase (isomerizing)